MINSAQTWCPTLVQSLVHRLTWFQLPTQLDTGVALYFIDKGGYFNLR